MVKFMNRPVRNVGIGGVYRCIGVNDYAEITPKALKCHRDWKEEGFRGKDGDILEFLSYSNGFPDYLSLYSSYLILSQDSFQNFYRV